MLRNSSISLARDGFHSQFSRGSCFSLSLLAWPEKDKSRSRCSLCRRSPSRNLGVHSCRNTFEDTYTSSSPFLAFGVRMRMRGVSFKASQTEDLLAHRYDFTRFSSVTRCLEPMRPLSHSRLVTSDWSCITHSQNRILFSFWEEGGGSSLLFFQTTTKVFQVKRKSKTQQASKRNKS